jgi:hypothetical protein
MEAVIPGVKYLVLKAVEGFTAISPRRGVLEEPTTMFFEREVLL